MKRILLFFKRTFTRWIEEDRKNRAAMHALIADLEDDNQARHREQDKRTVYVKVIKDDPVDPWAY